MTATAGVAAVAVIVWRVVKPSPCSALTSSLAAVVPRSTAIAPNTSAAPKVAKAKASRPAVSTRKGVRAKPNRPLRDTTSTARPAIRRTSASRRGIVAAPPSRVNTALTYPTPGGVSRCSYRS